MPQRLRLRARRFGRLLPALLDLVQLARGLLDVLRLDALGRVEAVLRAQRFGLARSALPGRRRSRSASTRPSRAARAASARSPPAPPAAARPARAARARRHRRLAALERGAQLARDPVGLTQRQVFGRRALGRALDQLFDALHLLPERPFGGRPALFGAQPHARLGARRIAR